MRKIFTLAFLLTASIALSAQNKATVTVHGDEPGNIIPKEIYGQFSEHLGSCIYGGLWVGPDSDIPNINGYRKDVYEALKELKVPLLRWPGGCFADEYHWMDGIGPAADRPKLINNNWGGTVEDNSFGTHEFLNLCEMLGCEPYISGNIGSGTVEELDKWIEYMTSDADSPMSRLRQKNGREKPWKVKYIGVGNETWGCGGSMRAEYYADVYRRYATFCRDFSGNHLYKIACGASEYDYNWTKVMMENVGSRMHGLSLHYYSVENWSESKGSATEFTTTDYYNLLGKSREIDEVLKNHIAVMNTYDPDNKVALVLDEWGTWFEVEPGTNPGHLFQQNTMRDAMVASTSLDIFHKYTERLKITNIAQIVNVLQSMILTSGNKMVLTPTYYVFKMYNVHQDATYLPTEVAASTKSVSKGRTLPMVSATASKDANGKVHISVSNIDADHAQTITVNLEGISAKSAVAQILHSAALQDHNTFDNPDKVKAVDFKDFKLKGKTLTLNMPAASIVTLELN